MKLFELSYESDFQNWVTKLLVGLNKEDVLNKFVKQEVMFNYPVDDEVLHEYVSEEELQQEIIKMKDFYVGFCSCSIREINEIEGHKILVS